MLKILLVDDEKISIIGIEYILKKCCPEHEIVGKAQSAREALEILENTKTNVVITDIKMPGINGTELIKIIKDRYSNISVIALSGYSDYDYVHEAMLNGASYYLLKPCSYQKILDVLGKIEHNTKTREYKSIADVREKVFLSSLTGKQELSGKWCRYSNYQLILISFTGCTGNETEDMVKKEFGVSSLNLDTFLCVNLDEYIVLFLVYPIELKTMMQKYYNYKHAVHNKGGSMYMAVYNFANGAVSLNKAYDYCRQMIGFLQFNEYSTMLDANTYQSYLQQQKKYEIGSYYDIQTISRYIFSEQVLKLQDYLSQSFYKLNNLSNLLDPVRIKKNIIKKLIDLECIIKGHGVDFESIFDRQLDYFYEMDRLKTLYQLLKWLRNFTMAIAMSVVSNEKIPGYIHVAIKYIETHFMEDISLKKLADEVYLNPWYFSTQFKKFTGLTYSEYINKVRIRYSKELLSMHKDLKIYQIAELVGFKDAAYFSTVFKNIEKKSPKEYQDTRHISN